MKKCNQYHPDQAKQDLLDTELCIEYNFMDEVDPGCDWDRYGYPMNVDPICR